MNAPNALAALESERGRGGENNFGEHIRKLPETLEDMVQVSGNKKIAAVLKSDGTPVKFAREKISRAIEKASKSSKVNYTPQQLDRLSMAVTKHLINKTRPFSNSGKENIPSREDVHEAVVETYDELNARMIADAFTERFNLSNNEAYELALRQVKGIDSTGRFYEAYKLAREEVGKALVEMPLEFEFDSTDKQLHIHKVKSGEAGEFDEGPVLDFLLEKCPNVTYDHAKEAIKGFEKILVARESDKPVSSDEMVSILDSKLMEFGYSGNQLLSGDRLSITFDDINQLVFSKSVENSNIQRNNPEAVNLGIAELALKEYALAKMFRPEVAKAHQEGSIHIHDLGFPQRVYCSAHSLEFIKRRGLDKVTANLDAKSSPATKAKVLNNHLHTWISAVQPSYAGAIGWPMLNTLMAPMELEDIEIIEGYELVKDIKGNEIKVVKRYDESELEKGLSSGTIVDFEEKSRKRIIRQREYKEFYEDAQNLVFGTAQAAYSKGGQTSFTDFNIDLGTPAHVRDVPALFGNAEYVRVRENEIGELEIVERTTEEPPRHKGKMRVIPGHERKHKNAKTEAEKREHIEPDPINGDVIQPEDGTYWLTYGSKAVEGSLQTYAKALLEVFRDGDKYGNPFNFPKCDVHVGEKTFEDEKQKELLKFACDVVEHNDSVYFMYDRGDGMNVAQCCRLRERIVDPEILKDPSKMRFCGFQIVSQNIPQAAFKAKGDTLEEKLQSTFKEIEKGMALSLMAHMDKRKYIQSLLDTDGTPMRAMGLPSDDGEPYIDLSKATYIFGIVGLNEAVQHLTGKQLHEDPESFKVGLRIVSHTYSIKNHFRDKYGLKFVIEETPGESANGRLARIDKEKFGEDCDKVLKGSVGSDKRYYTNSAHLIAEAEVSGLDRAILQAMSNPMIEAGAITHVYSGEHENKSNAVYDFVETVFRNSQSSQVVFSGKHTTCLECGTHVRGLVDECFNCGNTDESRLSQKTRVVGYMSDPRNWNEYKKEELAKRDEAQDFYAGEQDSTRDLYSELLESIIDEDKVRIAIVGTKDCAVCTDRAEPMVKRFVDNEKYVPKELRDKIEVVKYDVEDEEDRIPVAIYGAPIDSYPTIVVHRGDNFAMQSWRYPYKEKPAGVNTGQLANMFNEVAGNV